PSGRDHQLSAGPIAANGCRGISYRHRSTIGQASEGIDLIEDCSDDSELPAILCEMSEPWSVGGSAQGTHSGSGLKPHFSLFVLWIPVDSPLILSIRIVVLIGAVDESRPDHGQVKI